MKLSFVIDRFEGDQSVLVDSAGTEIIWPKSKLAEEFREGEALIFDISIDKENNAKGKAQSEDILNEILDINKL